MVDTLTSLVDDAAARTPDAVALRIDGTELTYADLLAEVEAAAAWLADHGVGVGSRVGLSAGNGLAFTAVVFATLRLGASLVMISTAWRDGEVGHALALTDPTHLVHDGSGACDLASRADRPTLDVADIPRGGGRATEPATVGPDTVAVMVFSSGTTGLPKAARHTHRSLGHAMRHWVACLGLGADDRMQITTPPFHILGLLNLLVVVDVGAGVRLHRRFALDEMLEAIEGDRITIEMAVAPIALAMAAHPELERFDLSSLRYIMWGATPVTESVARTVTERTGVAFLPAYGASELPVLSCNPVDRPAEWRLDSVGLPPDGVELRVVDLESGAPLGPGESGEIQGRSPSAMLGYLPEDANDDAFVDGWYRTGDVGSIDGDGWVTITDRVKEMIKVNAFQVAPAEVEAVLLAHREVVDAAVFGVPDDATGEAVIAAVVLAAESTVAADDLRAHVAESLAPYKRAREVLILDELPRLPSGKVLRRELQAGYGG